MHIGMGQCIYGIMEVNELVQHAMVNLLDIDHGVIQNLMAHVFFVSKAPIHLLTTLLLNVTVEVVVGLDIQVLIIIIMTGVTPIKDGYICMVLRKEI